MLNVNTDAIVQFANKLDRIGKTVLPNVVKGTLNDAAFDLKTKTMPSLASQFINRQANFFKANSTYDKAEGSNINSMRSMTGFYDNKLQNASTNYAIKDLEQQEHGGTISGKSFIPMDKARKSGWNTTTTSKLRITNLPKLTNVSNAKGQGWEQRFIKSAVHAGKNGFVLSANTGKGGAVFRIKGFAHFGKNTHVFYEKVYSFSKNRKIKVNPTHFMEKASLKSAGKLDDFFIKRAQAQINKALG